MFTDVVMFAAGLILLTVGADYLVRGVLTTAARCKLSPLVVSLTVVALGTSLPECFVTLNSVLEGVPGIGVGNVVGSNISNLLLILGVGGLIVPLATGPQMLGRDGMVMLGATGFFVLAASLGQITWPIGAAFLIALFGYLAACMVADRRRGCAAAADCEEDGIDLALGPTIVVMVASLAALIIGSELLIHGAVKLSLWMGVSETTVGLTLVAIGTSLPELATTVAAARRAQFDIILGNVLGSNLFNLLGVVGVVSLVAPVHIPPEILSLDLWLMVGVTLLALILLRSDWRLDRREAAVMLAAYVGYIAFQFTAVDPAVGGHLFAALAP